MCPLSEQNVQIIQFILQVFKQQIFKFEKLDNFAQLNWETETETATLWDPSWDFNQHLECEAPKCLMKYTTCWALPIAWSRRLHSSILKTINYSDLASNKIVINPIAGHKTTRGKTYRGYVELLGNKYCASIMSPFSFFQKNPNFPKQCSSLWTKMRKIGSWISSKQFNFLKRKLFSVFYK